MDVNEFALPFLLPIFGIHSNQGIVQRKINFTGTQVNAMYEKLSTN